MPVYTKYRILNNEEEGSVNYRFKQFFFITGISLTNSEKELESYSI